MSSESISEDVRQGSARLAMRLSECSPIEKLAADEGVLSQRIRDAANSKIMQLTIRLNDADKRTATLTRTLSSSKEQITSLATLRDQNDGRIKVLEMQLAE
jgi:hypothetical protein